MGSTLSTTIRGTTSNVARTAPTRTSQSVPKGDDEWAALLRDMSGAIQSRRWDGTAIAARATQEAHPAARGAAIRGRLPRIRAVTSTERQSGMLTQAEVVAVYKLCRTNQQKWDASALAERFKVSEQDIASLLRYTRTYKAHSTPEGRIYAFYDAVALPPVERFEDMR